MYQTRAQVTKKIPLPRKGTKYVARSLMDLENSVPVVVAVRDMLKLARTAKEVKKMINKKLLKINGKEVKDYRDSIRLFNTFQAGELYTLTFTPLGKFTLEKTKDKNKRPCRVIGKKILKGKKTQLNFHDGSNALYEKKVNTHDTVYLDTSGKLTAHTPMVEGKKLIIISGKYIGFKGKIENMKGNKIEVKLDGKEEKVTLEKRSIMVL